MERTSQPAHPWLSASTLLEALQARVPEANLYRLCQLIEQASGQPLGTTARPSDDPVRFRPDPGMGFPAGEFKGVELPAGQRPTVRTRLLGLYGVDSPLPGVYLDDIATQREGHEALEAFLDIFNHRIFTQFYRIWRKYSYPATFEPGGTDATSQCLLGLIGLGIPGSAQRAATPVSRFLALLGVMRLPTRPSEGIAALVTLLDPATRAEVTPHWPKAVPVPRPISLAADHPWRLGDGMPLGTRDTDHNSELLLTLACDTLDQVQAWLPGGQQHSDLLALLRVYLGWRGSATLRLSLPWRCLPAPVLGSPRLIIGATTCLPKAGGYGDERLTIPLGRYGGLEAAAPVYAAVEPAQRVCV
ncbi:type VI secretion system baseplate subunit TssG [Pseudomonas sp. NPDC007930]|uniref:type VI secretion system baseplate subunit TssG n=1 Tax=Pseudomonas sp. NPDC007930 TaxID=3364417 RepID=UPI0036E9A66C